MKPNQPKTKQCNLVVKTKWVKKNIRTDTIIFNLVMLWLFNNTPSTITNIGNSVKLGNTQKSTDQILETAQTRSDLINERVPNKMREIKWRKCRTSFPENGISWVEPLKNEKKTEGGGIDLLQNSGTLEKRKKDTRHFHGAICCGPAVPLGSRNRPFTTGQRPQFPMKTTTATTGQ